MLGRLYIEEGERPARMIELTGAVTIGRTADNDIVLESDGVSHCHAMLLAQPDGVSLLDLGSTFGTFVDAVQALPDEPLRLPNGARITIGRALLRYAAEPTALSRSSTFATHAMLTADPQLRPRIAIPSLNTRFLGSIPGEPIQVGQRLTLLIWVGAPIASDQWQSSRSLRWNGALHTSLALQVRVRAASPAWAVFAEEPIVVAEPWGSTQVARSHLVARRPDRTKLAICVERADSHRLVQHVLVGVQAVEPGIAAPSALRACRSCGALPHLDAKFCPACGSPRQLTEA